jgi:ribonucleases P/MRP protein subunit RPP40
MSKRRYFKFIYSFSKKIFSINNDLIECFSNPAKFFGDDSRVMCALNDVNSHLILQSDLNLAQSWCKTWLMHLNEDKCKIMHIGKRNAKNNYYINNRPVKETSCERDLGILISNDLKWHQQVSAVVSKANRMLGVLVKTFRYWDVNLMRQLNCVFIRPLLEYGIPAWNSLSKNDSRLLEKVQRRVTKSLLSTRNLDYQNRLLTFNMQSLQIRRIRGDLIQMYKAILRQDEINWYNPIAAAPLLSCFGSASSVRGNSMKLEIKQANTNVRQNFFTTRAARHWNLLSECCVRAPTLNSFKNYLDNHYLLSTARALLS